MRTLFLVLFLALFAYGQQVDEMNVKQMFGSSKTYIDSLGTSWLVSEDGSANVYEGRLVVGGGGGDITLVGKVESNSGSVDVTIEVGLDFGKEYGIEWYTAASLVTSDRWKFSFLAQPWGGVDVCKEYKIRITENLPQSNNYGIRAFLFKWR